MADRNLSYDNRQQARPSFGGLTYGSIRPEFVGQPVEDINKSRDILQARSDVAKNAYMDYNKTYGSVINQLNTKELPYVGQFDAKLNSKIQDRIANGEYEYIGADLTDLAGKFLSDQGLQKRIQNQQQYQVALTAIDKSDFNWDEKVKQKGWLNYQPVSPEEDATNTYKDKLYRTPEDQVEIAKGFMDAFRNLQPNVTGNDNKYFIKRNAVGTPGGYSQKDLTMNFEESDGTGNTYDYKKHTIETKSDRIKLLFKSLTDPTINPKYANYMRFKYELANRKPDETKEQFDARVKPEEYEKYLSGSSDLLAEQLANKQDIREAGVGFISGINGRARESAIPVEVKSYIGGINTKSPLSSVEESNKTAQSTIVNNNRLLADQQSLLNIDKTKIKTANDLLEEFKKTGKGVGEQINAPKGESTIVPQMVNTIQQGLSAQNLIDTRLKTAVQSAKDAAKARGATDVQLSMIDDYYTNVLKNKTTTTSEDLKARSDFRSSNYITPNGDTIPVYSPFRDLIGDVGDLVKTGWNKMWDNGVIHNAQKDVDTWFENNNSQTKDSHIISTPILAHEDAKKIDEEMGKRVTNNLVNNADGNDVFILNDDGTSEPLGTEKINYNIQTVETLGYDPVPKGPKGDRHWAFKIFDKDANGTVTTHELLLPMSMITTPTMDRILGDPRVLANDLIQSVDGNNIKEREIPGVSGAVIKSVPNVGKSLVIGGRVVATDPEDMQMKVLEILQMQRNELINGKSKK